MPKKSEKTRVKINFDFLKNPYVRNGVLIVLILALGYLVQYFINKPDFGVFLSADMDPSSNTYVLGVDVEKDQFKVTKIDSWGSVSYQINLDKSDDKTKISYSNLEVDTKGNFYFLKTSKDLNAVVVDKSMTPIKTEEILMYDTNGGYVKKIVNVDLSKEAQPLTKNYIKKIQFVDQQMTVIACKNNVYDVIKANPLIDESPKKEKSFSLVESKSIVNQDIELAVDFAMLSNGRVVYSTEAGEFYAMDNQGQFIDYSTSISSNKCLVYGFSVDASDNLYMTDALSGDFYKLNTKSSVAEKIYGLDSAIGNNGKIKVQDVRKIKAIEEDDYFAPSKTFENMYFVRFGTTNKTISDLTGNFFPWGILIFAITCLAAVGVFYLVRYLSKLEIARMSISLKILVFFVPVYLVAMLIILGINTFDGTTSYVSILRGEQGRGAKIIAENITSTDFTKINYPADVVGADYVKVQNEIKKGYYDLALKIGDKSDYVVAYIEEGGKLYTTFSTKYDPKSTSYDKLKYTDPDMIVSESVLVDTLLERDENETIYKIWEDFYNKKSEDIVEALFRDVYGDLSASFVAIKDASGRPVGMVGNFLDEDIHRNSEFWAIMQRSIAMISIVAFLVIAYIWFVIYRVLKPLKRIKVGIDAISRGEWQTKLVVSSKDELSDVARAFNLMSEKIERYTKNLIRLNDEYVRYVPSELFKFMDKQKITQVGLHDHKILNMNVIYVTFNLSKKGALNFNDENEIFEVLNESFHQFFKVVEDNNGVVQSFDGLDMVVLFPTCADDAMKAAMQFKEIKIDEKLKQNMVINVGSGDVLVGVSGNEKRRGIVVVSDEIIQMFNIDTRISTIGIKQVATKSVIDSITQQGICEYRFIGNISNVTGDDFTPVYHVIDASNKYRRDLYMSTKEIFEKAVETYLVRDFEAARKMFTSVIRTNENDKVAIFYLMKCEEYLTRSNKKPFDGTLI